MWQLNGHKARFCTPEFETLVNVAEPWNGLTNCLYRGEVFAAAGLLQADVRELVAEQLAVSETYIRGCDLVATYTPSRQRPVRVQIYWRARVSQEIPAAGMEMILSAQTDLLDSNPQVHARSTFQPGQLLGWNAQQAACVPECEPSNLYLYRPASGKVSYCEMLHSTDFSQVALSHTPPQLTWSLFPERLEKGVIRRARLAGMFVPRDSDQAASLAAYHAFEAAPLPLTT